jgi:CheY-like chemotaxis protein
MGLLNFFNKKPPAAPPQPVSKGTILVVDDEKFLRDFYQELLTGEGYQVITATNGQEALIAAQKMPNLILLDIMMPLMDGNEVLKRLNLDPKTKNIPVILLTNAGNLNNMDHAKLYSAYKFLIKSNVSPPEVLDTIKEALTNPTVQKTPSIAKQPTQS